MTDPDQTLSFVGADALKLVGLLRRTAGSSRQGALIVPGSRHERDSFATTAEALADGGIASLRIDLRGRGTNAGPVSFADMGPLQRRHVRGDVAAGVQALSTATGIDPMQIAVITEQDTVADSLLGGLDAGCGAAVVLSARMLSRALGAVTQCSPPLFGLVSTDDREGLRQTVDAYLASGSDLSRLVLLQGRGIGATMFHTSDRNTAATKPLEAQIASWLVATLATPTPPEIAASSAEKREPPS